MENIKYYKAECLLLAMMITQGIAIFLPHILSSDVSNILLLILLIGFIICKIERIDYAIKRKFN